MRVPSWAANAARPFYRERVSRGYLAVVAVSVVLMLLDTAVLSHGHASFAGMLLLILTLPWTPLLFALFTSAAGMNEEVTAYHWSGWTLTLVAALISALVNAALLGYAARVSRRRAATR